MPRGVGKVFISCTLLLEPVGGWTTESVTHGQVTFPAAEHHRPLAGTKLYCLVTRGTWVWTTCPESLPVPGSVTAGSWTHDLSSESNVLTTTLPSHPKSVFDVKCELCDVQNGTIKYGDITTQCLKDILHSLSSVSQIAQVNPNAL